MVYSTHRPFGPLSRARLCTLVVDPAAQTRTIFAEYLRRRAYRVEECEDGRDALVKAISLLPDIVVTDTHVPLIDGFQLCQLLRQDPATQAIPIVIMTASAVSPDVERGEAAGA